MKFLSKFYIGLIFLILYAPILVVVIFSFNDGGTVSEFTEFSFYWYAELFRDEEALVALKNSLFLAVTSSVLATAIGTLAAFSITRAKNKYYKRAAESISNIPMMNPDIVTGVSMMLLFVGVGAIIGLSDTLGMWTMLMAHTTFNLPYAILQIMPRFRQMDKNLTEAALDLGCTPAQTFLRVELPYIMPGVVSGLMMGFTLSLDDFVISHFVSSPDFKTLPLYIYNQTAHEVKFSMYALCTLMIVAILILLIAVNVAGSAGESRMRKRDRKQLQGVRK